MPTDTVTLDAWNFEEIADKRPTDYIYALMSNHVYNDIKKDDTLQFEKNWVVKRVSDDTSRYFGVIYINNKENHIVVAHRGTSSIRAVIEDIHGIVLNNISPQKAAAFELVREAIKLAKKKNYSLSFTGHSLGAFLAELSVFYCKRDGFDKVNAVTFESPGSKESLEKLQSNLESHTINLSNLDIVAYVTYPNLINTYNHHVGTMYTITPNLGKFGYIPGRYTQQAHIMAGILECLSGKKSFDERKLLIDWPVNNLSDQQMSQFFKVATFNAGSYLLPADEELNTHQYFTLLYKAHYNSDPELGTHNILPIKHFREDMQKFLVIFKSWREKNKYNAKQKLEEIIRDNDIVNYLLNYQLITHNQNTFLVIYDTEVAVFRRELSKFLEEKGSQIKELINSLPSANLEIIAAILAPSAQLLAGGVIEHAKVAGLNITISEGTSQEDIAAFKQILEKAKEGVGKISAYIVAPGASCSGSISDSKSYGMSVEQVQRATPPAITPSYNSTGTVAGSSLSSRITQEKFSEEQIREIESRRISGESPSPLA